MTDGGSPVPGAAITAIVTHADGSTEEIELTTGNDGTVTYTVVPVDAGTTTVEMCIDGNCDFGVLTMDADNPPQPPAVATYLGPTIDMGPSQAILDGTDDFDDPYTGGPAEPGIADPRMDITSYRYLGNDGGTAMWEITTLGNACELYEDPATPWFQFTVFVSSPDDQHYNVTYRTSAGAEPYANAYSNGVNLGSTVMLPSCSNGVITISATGVDVPPGSQMQVVSWYSLDPLSSGYQDFADGFPTAVVPDPIESTSSTVVTTTAAVAASTTSPEPTSTSGSFPIWIPIVVFGVAVGGYFAYRSTRPDGVVALSTGTDEVTDADLAQYRSGDLGSYTDVYAGDGAGSDHIPDGLDSGWANLLAIEEEIQEAYLGAFRALLGDITEQYRSYRSAIDVFKEKFVKIASGTTELQGYLQRWAENRQTAQKQDIAFAIITVVWGIGSLGVKTVQWISRGRTTRALATAADEAAAVSDAVSDAATAVDSAIDPSTRKIFDRYAAELGVDADAWIARHGNDFTKADRALRNQVGLARGWHGITRNAEDVINRLLVNGRGAVAGRAAQIDPADVAKLKEWARADGFWEGLATAAGEISYDVVQSAGGSGPVGDVIQLFYNADDIKFLKQLVAVDGDAAALAKALGPAQVSALELLTDAGFAGAGIAGLGGSLNSLLSGQALTGGLDLGSYTDQFGGWVGSVDAGLGWAVLDGLWGLVTSPFETFSGLAHTLGAQGRYIDFLASHGDDLTGMGSALQDAVDSLSGMIGAIERADLDDPTSSLGGRSADRLRGLIDEMDAHEASASDDWRARNSDDVAARRAHIQQKIADIERVTDALQDQLLRLSQIRDWINGLRTNPDGSLRDAVDLWNPEILARLGAADLMLGGMVVNALTGGSSPQPPSAPADEVPPPRDPFDGDDNPFADFDTQSDAAYEAEWRGELDDVFGDE